MTAELPRPGSIWIQTRTGRQMRAVLSDHTGIVAHDCEQMHNYPPNTSLLSWAGTPEDFAKEFQPGDAAAYPKTAN